MLFNPSLKWGPAKQAKQAISEVQWAWESLSGPRPLVLFSHLFSSFLCFDTSGIVGSSPVGKQYYQNMSNFFWEDHELFLVQERAGSIWYLQMPAKLFSWKLNFTPGAQEGHCPEIWRKPWWPKGTTILRSPCLELPGEVSAHPNSWASTQLLDTTMALQWLLGACFYWEPPPLLPLLLLGLLFSSPLTKHIQMVRCLPQSRGSGE